MRPWALQSQPQGRACLQMAGCRPSLAETEQLRCCICRPAQACIHGRATRTWAGVQAGLGIGATQHSELAEGEVGRKGMSCERTFATISETADLYAKVCQSPSQGAGMLGACLQGLVAMRGLVLATTHKLRHHVCLQLEELAEKLAADLAAKDLKGKTLTLKLKATTFEVS